MTEKRKLMFVDIETFSKTDLKACGVYRYCDDPAFEVLLFAYAYDNDPVEVVDIACGEILPAPVLGDLIDPNVIKIAHNANFERTCLTQWLGIYMEPEQWECTAVRASTLGLPRSLEDVGNALGLKEDEKKMAIGKRLIRYFCVPCPPTKTNGRRTRNLPHHEPEKWALFKEYNKQDVVTERAIYRMMESAPATIPEEHALWCLDQKINEGGVLIDTTLVENILDYSERYAERLENRARQISGIANPSSFQQIRVWLRSKNLNPPTLDKDGVKQLIADCKDTHPDVVEFMQIRQELGKTSVAKYDAMARAMCHDKRVHGMLQFYGAERTGRWCLAEGTLVLTNQGEIPIEDVTAGMKLWDGEKWVEHEGVVYMGDKDVIEWDGVKATPDHEVFIDPKTKIKLMEAKERCIPIWKGNSPYTK